MCYYLGYRSFDYIQCERCSRGQTLCMPLHSFSKHNCVVVRYAIEEALIFRNCMWKIWIMLDIHRNNIKRGVHLLKLGEKKKPFLRSVLKASSEWTRQPSQNAVCKTARTSQIIIYCSFLWEVCWVSRNKMNHRIMPLWHQKCHP